MSRDGKSSKLDLKLNLSPPRVNPKVESPKQSGSMSPQSSCVSSEASQLSQTDQTIEFSNSPDATPMVLLACLGCHMYVMTPKSDPKCPKCKGTALFDFLNDPNISKKKSRKN